MHIVRAHERLHTDLGWLDSWHSFSFGEHYDSTKMGVGPLRVLNDDRVAPGAGFGAHPHRDMEIISYVLEGGLAHEDSEGGRGVVSAGEIQFMRAGSGVLHAERNASATEPVHFLQIWIRPQRRGLEPMHEHRRLDLRDDGSWQAVAGDGGFPIDQAAHILASRLAVGVTSGHKLATGRQAFLFVIEGEVEVGDERLRAGDSATIQAPDIVARAVAPAHLLLFDLPMI
jgi:redox-sensitive bicupin YhaK (pirin superfamily)